MSDELKWVGRFMAQAQGGLGGAVEVHVCCTVDQIETTDGLESLFGHFVYSIAQTGRRVHQINGRADLFEVEVTGEQLIPTEPIDFEAFERRLRGDS